MGRNNTQLETHFGILTQTHVLPSLLTVREPRPSPSRTLRPKLRPRRICTARIGGGSWVGRFKGGRNCFPKKGPEADPTQHDLSGPISRDTAILSLRYPISRDTFSGNLALPHNGAIPPPWYLVSHRHICAIPHFATYRAIIVRYPTKTSTKYFCDTIAASIARYEKYRYWASKSMTLDRKFPETPVQMVIRNACWRGVVSSTFGNGPSTVSESTVSNTELLETSFPLPSRPKLLQKTSLQKNNF